MSFKETYKMVGFSADWVNRAWSVMNNDDRQKVIVFEEDDKELLLFVVEYHGEDYEIQTAQVFSTYDENEMTKHLEENDYFYNCGQWMHKLPTQMMEPLNDLDWIK